MRHLFPRPIRYDSVPHPATRHLLPAPTSSPTAKPDKMPLPSDLLFGSGELSQKTEQTASMAIHLWIPVTHMEGTNHLMGMRKALCSCLSVQICTRTYVFFFLARREQISCAKLRFNQRPGPGLGAESNFLFLRALLLCWLPIQLPGSARQQVRYKGALPGQLEFLSC